jgi:HAD superfamily phosphatase
MHDSKTTFACSAILFDMDGVLINTSGSYDEATRTTVASYICEILGLQGPPSKPDHETLLAFKKAGGFNNDWDMTRAILLRIIDCLGLESAPASPDEWKEHMPSISCEKAIEKAQLKDFARDLKKAGGGYAQARSMCTPQSESWLLGFGEVRGANLVERIFQEHYLGSKHFISIYRSTPRFHDGPGLIESERALCTSKMLLQLSETVPLAIVTGRPRKEAQIGLKQFELEECFEVLVALDDALHGKPHPAPVIRALKRLGMPERFIYIGDMPDDLKAARAAAAELEIEAYVIGLCAGAPNEEHRLLEIGFNEAFSDPNKLINRLLAMVGLS